MFVLIVILFIALNLLIETLFAYAGVHIVAKFKPPFKMVFKAVFFGWLVSIMIGILALPFPNNNLVLYSVYGLTFLSVGVIYGVMIGSEREGRIGMAKGFLVLLVQLGMTIILAMVVAAVLKLFGVNYA